MGVTAAVTDFTVFVCGLFSAFVLGGFVGADINQWCIRRGVRRAAAELEQDDTYPGDPGSIDHQAIANIIAEHRDRTGPT